MNCPNCDSKLSCGCQKRRASDGKDVCTNCLALYESQIVNQNLRPADAPATAPSEIKVSYTQNPTDTP